MSYFMLDEIVNMYCLPGTTIEDTAVTPTPSLTPSAAAGGQRTGVRTVGGVSDPAIDEHFKRSLGLEEYAAVFNATTTDKEAGLSGTLLKKKEFLSQRIHCLIL